MAEMNQAAQVLESIGLGCLAERWWLRLDGTTRIAVEIVEASPLCVVVRNVDYGHEGNFGDRFTFAVPLGDDRLARR